MDKKRDLLKLKKKILVYMAYATLGLTSISGCQKIQETETNYGTISYNNVIKYDDFKDYVLIEYISEGGREYTIAKEIYIGNEYSFVDAVTGIIIESNEISILCDSIDTYLKKYDRVKEVYNIEDIEIITNEILSDEDINKLLPIEEKRTLNLN